MQKVEQGTHPLLIIRGLPLSPAAVKEKGKMLGLRVWDSSPLVGGGIRRLVRCGIRKDKRPEGKRYA
jgi:hypothetical protein